MNHNSSYKCIYVNVNSLNTLTLPNYRMTVCPIATIETERNLEVERNIDKLPILQMVGAKLSKKTKNPSPFKSPL